MAWTAFAQYKGVGEVVAEAEPLCVRGLAHKLLFSISMWNRNNRNKVKPPFLHTLRQILAIAVLNPRQRCSYRNDTQAEQADGIAHTGGFLGQADLRRRQSKVSVATKLGHAFSIVV